MTERNPNINLAGDALHEAHPDRCRVCALPLPKGETKDGICSRRCAARRGESAAVRREAEALTDRLLAEIARLKDGTTLCPGELGQRILPEVPQALTVLRPLIFELAAARRLRLSQHGAVVGWWKIKGPFRVKP